MKEIYSYLWSILFILLGVNAKAGLVVEISPEINIAKIQQIIPYENGIKVIYRNGSKNIQLPEDALIEIIKWASKEAQGPFVFSIDQALIGDGATYTPAPVPHALANAMLDYDVYAHSLALGGIPDDEKKHPLYKKYGKKAFPAFQMVHLLDEENLSNEAVWYRRLTTFYATAPEAVGEFTIRAIPSEKGFPIKTEVFSHRWMRSHLWYREIEVPSQWDRWAFGLPYRLLKKDMEERWEVYRSKFEPLGELASITETYALLVTLRKENPVLWDQFIKSLNQQNLRNQSYIYTSSSPWLSSFSSMNWNASEMWNNLSLRNVGKEVETSAEANLAIALIKKGYGSYSERWARGIEKIAKVNNRIRAKWLLTNIDRDLNKGHTFQDVKPGLQTFFDLVSSDPALFRLRTQAYNILSNPWRYSQNDSLKSFLSYQRTVLLHDFMHIVDVCHDNVDPINPKLEVWEDLTQNVYSVGLLSIAEEEYGNRALDPALSARIALVHRYRGTAFQKGMEIAYRHAHFRYLKYLADRTRRDDSKYCQFVLSEINTYRGEIADLLGMTNWLENY